MYRLPRSPALKSAGRQIALSKLAEDHGRKSVGTYFIINLGQATAQEVRDLMQHATEQIRQRTGIMLEPEICILGDA
jgi:UDP-N-acetylenolpyruvoylglucosamine reductase